MEPVRPRFLPDAGLDREDMEALQRDIAATAVFDDDHDHDLSAPDRVRVSTEGSIDPPLVAGVDQAFLDERAISAVVVTRGDEVVERVHAVTPLEIPYIPGLLAFREGAPIVAALRDLETAPDVALFDGSGRIHYRQAGLATHVGVVFDLPSIGVAKSLLCGEPARSLEDRYSTGTRIPIAADDEVDAPAGTTIGYALQTRQFDGGDRYVNPLYVSPGHRVSADTAADVVERCCAGYKLPEPVRLADRYADQLKAEVD